jgi:DUF1365 family protein
MRSCLYAGWVRHRRFAPVEHAFKNRIFLPMLDLGELEEVFEGRWLWSTRRPALAWFRRKDYLGDPSVPLDTAVRDLVEQRTGTRPEGPISVLAHPRYFGYVFNPVSFYYCYPPGGDQLETIVAEITNTPWKERHAYVLSAREAAGSPPKLRFRFAKNFHVSPFMPMDHDYDWTFTPPGQNHVVHMENLAGGDRVFDATMRLERRPLTGPELARALVAYPLMTTKVTLAIYWNALRLRLKRAPFHDHPKHAAQGANRP